LKALVFGGREYGMTIDTSQRHPVLRIKPDEIKALFDTLDEVYMESETPFFDASEITSVIVGCAPGADFLGAVWAASRGIPVEEFPADWSKGSIAGPSRNTQMAEAEPELGVRFGGGTGSNNMELQLKQRDIPVQKGYVP